MIARLRPRWSARPSSLLAVVGIMAFLTFTPAMVGAAQANAIPGITDCKDSPTPDTPGTGPAYWFMQPPVPPPAAGDAFGKNTTTSIYEQYGFAGLTFQTYDLGCGGVARDPVDVTMNGLSNMLMQIPVMIVGFTGWVLDAAFNPQKLFGPLDNYIGSASAILRDKVFNVWAVPLLVAAGVWLMARARRRDLGGLATWALTAVGSVVLLSMLTSYPQAAGHTADSVVAGTVGQVASGFGGQDTGNVKSPADSTLANMHRAVLFGPWESGTFGNANNQMARTYGPALFDAQALTWQQANLPSDDRKKVIEDKKKAFADIMGKIKDQDESIYEIVQGKSPSNRFGAVIVSGVGATISSAFLLVSGLLMLAAFVIVRLGVMLAPVLLVLAFFPPLLPRVRGAFEGIGVALLGCIAFGVGAALNTLLIGQVMAPGSSLSPVRQILLVFLLAVAFFFILWPFLRVHKAFKHAMERAVDAGGRGWNDWKGRLSDDDSRQDREHMEAIRQERERANRRRPEAAPTTPNVVQMAASRGAGETPDGRINGAYAPPHDREAWARGRQVSPTTQRALPAGSGRQPEDVAARAAQQAKDRVPFEPDAIYRPEGSGRSGSMPSAPPRPRVNDGAELYRFQPYRAENDPNPPATQTPANVTLPRRRPEAGG